MNNIKKFEEYTKEETSENDYISSQLDSLDSLSRYDPDGNDFKMKITNGSKGTKWINITDSQFEKLRNIFK